MPERTFPHSHTGFPAPWKSLFRTPEKAHRDRHKRITLILNTLRKRPKIRPYGGGGSSVRLEAILSELKLYASSSPLHHMARSNNRRMSKYEEGVWRAKLPMRHWNEDLNGSTG